ncbi:MAG: hypothetical protein P8010_08165 [Desulfosarcinaceae bacterium]
MLDALRIMKASVKKWDRIIKGRGSDGGVLDCPPCRIFYALVCTGCPIVYCEECRRLATEMRDFMVVIVDHLSETKERASTQKASRKTMENTAV